MRSPLDTLYIDTLLVHLVQRRHVAESFDFGNHEIGDVVDFLFRVETTESETNRRVREIFVETHRTEHVARLEARARAGRAARDGHVFDGHHEPLAFDEGEGDVQVSG